MNWVGTYSDPVYGGYIDVCVSHVNGVYHGQGLFSGIGYMRGTINETSNVWEGNFWTAGQEVKQGSFHLLLSGSSYEGTFLELPDIVYSIDGSKISSDTPDDLLCMKSDDYLLTTTETYNFTGAWVGSYDQQVYDNNDMFTAAYSYMYQDGSIENGVSYHNPYYLGGQVSAGDWFESADTSGIELYVAKNETTYYSLFWAAPRVADVDYASMHNNTDMFALGYFYLDHSEISYTEAAENMCMMLPTTQTESACLSGSTTSTSTSSEDDEEAAVDEGGLVGVVIGVFFGGLFVGLLIGYLLFNAATSPKGTQPVPTKETQMVATA